MEKLARGGTVCVGWDYRDSSPTIRDDVFRAVNALGMHPVACGAIPTPALALHAMSDKAAAIMITGSHIPADRNGLKFFAPDGEITKDDEAAINLLATKVLSTDTFTLPEAITIDESEKARARFLDRYRPLTAAKPLTGWTVGVYQHSTVARDLLAQILEEAGAVTVILGRSESFIPVDTEAISDATRALLKDWSKHHKLDAIVSADGDGDRPLMADENGEVVRGDALGLIAANYLNASLAVIPVTCNSGIERSTAATILRTRVGSPYVIAAMNNARSNGTDRVVGFEANGGFLTGTVITIDDTAVSPLPTRDCFLPLLVVLLHAARSRQKLSELEKSLELPVALSGLIREFAAERSVALLDHLRVSPENLAAFLAPMGKIASVNDTDGLRITLEDGSIVHLRPSGNAPEFRCYVEASTLEKSDNLLYVCTRQVKGLSDTLLRP